MNMALEIHVVLLNTHMSSCALPNRELHQTFRKGRN